MSKIVITSKNYDAEVINSDKPVLLDFWASWCGPCKMLSPILTEISDEHPEIKVGTINVDDEPYIANKFMVSSIPTVVLMDHGKIVKTMIGYRPKEYVLDFIK